MIRAADIETAYEKATNIGLSEEHQYENMYGAQVYWEFVGLASLVESLFEGDIITDGTEVRS